MDSNGAVSAPQLDLQLVHSVMYTLECWAEAMLGSWATGQSNAPHFGHANRKNKSAQSLMLVTKKECFRVGRTNSNN